MLKGIIGNSRQWLLNLSQRHCIMTEGNSTHTRVFMLFLPETLLTLVIVSQRTQTVTTHNTNQLYCVCFYACLGHFFVETAVYMPMLLGKNMPMKFLIF